MSERIPTGDIGENLVQLWASQVGITPNPVRRDHCGWDFCFQFKHRVPPANVPMDLVPPSLTCMIQVKTTACNATSEDVTLSNWERMVKDPLPWFFVRVAVDADGEASAVYLIHVDEKWMARILKRLRSESSSTSSTNRQTVSLTWNESDAVAAPYGPGLRDRIRSTVGDPSKYVEQKIRNFRDLGYEGHRYTVRIKTAFEKTAEDFARAVDFAIGLTDSYPIVGMTIVDDRFGDPVVLEDHHNFDGGSMKFSSPPSIDKSSLLFTNASRSKFVTIGCKVFVPTILFPDLPMEYFRARFASSMIDVVAAFNSRDVTLKWSVPDGEQTALLSDLESTAKVMDLFASSNADDPIEIVHEVNGRELVLAYGTSPLRLSDDVREMIRASEDAGFIARHFGLPMDTAVRVEDIHREMGALAFLRTMLQGTTDGLEISIGIPEAEIESVERAAIVLPVGSRIGETLVVGIVNYHGPATIDVKEKTLKIRNGTARILRTWNVSASDWETFNLSKKTRDMGESVRKSGDFNLVVGPGFYMKGGHGESA